MCESLMHGSQLSLVFPPWLGTMSTSEICEPIWCGQI